jgi:hypothetical protein
MDTSTYPKPAAIRRALLVRTAQFCRLTGRAPSSVCKDALNDPNFYKQVRQGRSFRLDSYARMHRYLDRRWPEPIAKANGAHKA